MRLNPEKVMARMQLMGVPDIEALTLILGPDVREDGRRARKSFGISSSTLRQYMAGSWVRPIHGRKIAKALQTRVDAITLAESEGGDSTREKTEWVNCNGSPMLFHLIMVSSVTVSRVEDDCEFPRGFLAKLTREGPPRRVDMRRIQKLARYFRIRTDQALGIVGGPCKHPEWLEDAKFKPLAELRIG